MPHIDVALQNRSLAGSTKTLYAGRWYGHTSFASGGEDCLGIVYHERLSGAGEPNAKRMPTFGRNAARQSRNGRDPTFGTAGTDVETFLVVPGRVVSALSQEFPD
jgi:hypothetical protein